MHIAFEIFDRYGRLKQELKCHSFRKGTGHWGSELDHGDLLIIEEVSVAKKWRGKGIGTRIAMYLVKKSQAEKQNLRFWLAEPRWLPRDIRPEIEGVSKAEQRQVRLRATKSAISFWRRCGFRRIGASGCFCFATAPDHRTRTLPSAEDFDLPVADEEPDEDEPRDILKISRANLETAPDRTSWRPNRLQKRLPLHHAVFTLKGSECLEFFREAFRKSQNPAGDWGRPDGFSKNVLHIAACELKVQSVSWLLKWVNEGQILSSARNIHGYTPLEALEAQLESEWTKIEYYMINIVMSDKFRGFAVEAIECIAELRGLQPFPHPISSTTVWMHLWRMH